MDRILDTVPPKRLSCLMLGASEVASVLVRRHNSGTISGTVFTRARNDLIRDVIHSGEFSTLPASNADIEDSMPFLEGHALNATDAVLLRIALDLQATLLPVGDDLALVASDERLLRAAKAEGLETFNPETQSEAEMDALLARS